jgi:hypothetical protein
MRPLTHVEWCTAFVAASVTASWTSARYARFPRPGHAVTGVRDKTAAEKRVRRGYEYAHTIVDDHSRLAYSELHPDQRADTVTAFVRRALDWFFPRRAAAADHDRQRRATLATDRLPDCSPST